MLYLIIFCVSPKIRKMVYSFYFAELNNPASIMRVTVPPLGQKYQKIKLYHKLFIGSERFSHGVSRF